MKNEENFLKRIFAARKPFHYLRLLINKRCLTNLLLATANILFLLSHEIGIKFRMVANCWTAKERHGPATPHPTPPNRNTRFQHFHCRISYAPPF